MGRKSLIPINRLSLKVRLGLIFSGLILLAIIFSALTLWQQYRIAVRGANLAIQQSAELDKAVELRDTLDEIANSVESRAVRDGRIARFRKLLGDVRTDDDGLEEGRVRRSVSERFEKFAVALRDPAATSRQAELKALQQDVSASVGSLIEIKQMMAWRMAHRLRQEQESSMKLAFGLLALLIVVLVLGALKVIAVVTEPLSTLARTMDEVNVEDDMPAELPSFSWDSPEIVRVARSFEALLNRLRGYRLLNVRRLLAEKRRGDVIAASISDGIFLLRGQELLYVNPVGERILELPGGVGWKGLNIAELPVTGSKGASSVRASLERTMPLEFKLVGEDGRPLYYLIQSYEIAQDLVEHVDHTFNGGEQFLDRWKATTLVMARDVSLVHESQEAKGHFIGTLSHEVKTPVTSLSIATRLLKKSVEKFENPSHRQLILTCADDVDRLRVLIDDLVSVSNFDTLTQGLAMQSVDLAKLVKQSVQSFQPQAFEKQIEITTANTTGVPKLPVAMDATKISWAISNLMTNALRHTPRGGKVEVSVMLNGDDRAEVHVRDNGPGIEPARQEHIFEKFSSHYDLRVGRSGSVGMGLAIAREIISAHGGEIWVKSEAGSGAEFCFTLPLRQAGGGLVKSDVVVGSTLKGDSSGASARS